MTTRLFQTNLNCDSCIARVSPYLNREPAIQDWSVDTTDPRKILSVKGDAVSREIVSRLVSEAGFQVLGELPPSAKLGPAAKPDPSSNIFSSDPATPQKRSFLATYYPLILVLSYLVGLVALAEVNAGSFHWMRAMSHFMGGFFVAFSFFKLLDLRGFVAAYQTYDVLAQRSRFYGFAYPLMELALGLAYLAGVMPLITNLTTLVLMLIGLVGVTKAILAKRTIQCACLGTVFQLPMSYVTFLEDSLMAVMALAMLVGNIVMS